MLVSQSCNLSRVVGCDNALHKKPGAERVRFWAGVGSSFTPVTHQNPGQTAVAQPWGAQTHRPKTQAYETEAEIWESSSIAHFKCS